MFTCISSIQLQFQALASSGASTTASAPPDSPTLASQSLMSDGTAVAATPLITTTPTLQNMHAAQFTASASERDVSQSAQDPLSRSARVRAFKAFRLASPEERERIRSFGLGTAGTDGDNSAARTEC
jgi:hypothetical protein